jgi:hypothetical protein
MPMSAGAASGWLAQRRGAFDGSTPQLDRPKGLLLLGVQGAAKPRGAPPPVCLPCRCCVWISARCTTVRKSERNLRESLKTAEIMAPCVLWIDEIQKSLATGDGDNGRRGECWARFDLADREALGIFVVATANDISALPPELVRRAV